MTDRKSLQTTNYEPRTTNQRATRANEPAFVYFDLDDTLLDHRTAEKNALADVRAAFPDAFDGITAAQVQQVYHQHNELLWERYSDGEIEKEELKRLRIEQMLETLAVDGVAPERIGAHYIERYTHHWTPTDGAFDAFERVADRFPVGLLTNGFSETQHAKIERFPVLAERAETVVVGEETGFLKPDARVFARAAELASSAPTATLYVGNSLRSDVEGGLGAGWQVAWYTPYGLNGETPPQSDRLFRFETWPQLTNWLL